ncbi:hypothetical protein SRIMM317S_03549 [Streptomyces rimosus subsp. rimosus]
MHGQPFDAGEPESVPLGQGAHGGRGEVPAVLVVELVEGGAPDDLAEVRVLEDESAVGSEEFVQTREQARQVGDIAHGVGGVHDPGTALGGDGLTRGRGGQEVGAHPRRPVSAPSGRLEGQRAHPGVRQGPEHHAVRTADLDGQGAPCAAQFGTQEVQPGRTEMLAYHGGAGRVVRVPLVRAAFVRHVARELDQGAALTLSGSEAVADRVPPPSRASAGVRKAEDSGWSPRSRKVRSGAAQTRHAVPVIRLPADPDRLRRQVSRVRAWTVT